MNYLKTAFVCAVMAASAPAFGPAFATSANLPNLFGDHPRIYFPHPITLATNQPLNGAVTTQPPIKNPENSNGHPKGAIRESGENRAKSATASNEKDAHNNVAELPSDKTEQDVDEPKLISDVQTDQEKEGDLRPAIAKDSDRTEKLSHLNIDRENVKSKAPIIAIESNTLKPNAPESKSENPEVSEESKFPKEQPSKAAQDAMASSTANGIGSIAMNTSVPEIDGTYSGLAFSLLISIVAAFRERRTQKLS